MYSNRVISSFGLKYHLQIRRHLATAGNLLQNNAWCHHRWGARSSTFQAYSYVIISAKWYSRQFSFLIYSRNTSKGCHASCTNELCDDSLFEDKDQSKVSESSLHQPHFYSFSFAKEVDATFGLRYRHQICQFHWGSTGPPASKAAHTAGSIRLPPITSICGFPWCKWILCGAAASYWYQDQV